ncbi:MAG: hypothetical protein GX025_06175 [Clostridiales bacterium]|nr:hypothetical protein [Clostridiales bacterium]
MQDFLRVTTPLINKNQAVLPKTGVDPAGAFSIQNTTQVVHTHNQSELLKQNTNMLENSDAPTLLLNLLKDPTVTVTYLKNFFMLEELFKLLPANNSTISKEIRGIFQGLLLSPEALAQEMKNQENAATVFKGELFDFLRVISEKEQDKPEVQQAIARFLRSVNSAGSGRDLLDSVGNNLEYLRDELASSKNLSAKLDTLINAFRMPNAMENFQNLKSETLALIKEIESSILFSPKLGKVLSILTYNLSRINSNEDYTAETAFRLRQFLSPEDRKVFVELHEKYMGELREGGGFSFINAQKFDQSTVMNLIIELISRQRTAEGMSESDYAKTDKMLHSLLSSPCNFTPLLHFILPLQQDDMRAFAEIWINPEGDDKDMPDGVSGGMHFLMVIDVESVGRFEAEFFVRDGVIDMALYCPEGTQAGYEELMRSMPKLVYGTNYRIGTTRVAPLENPRSLMDVFKSLPYRRVGVDVKI